MPFVNPFTGITITFPKVIYQDYWLWTGIQGESYAPTFSGGGAYGSKNGAVGYSLPSATSVATFPKLPRIGPNQTAVGTLTISWQTFSPTTPSGGNNNVLQPFSSDATIGGHNFEFGDNSVAIKNSAGAASACVYAAGPQVGGVWHSWVVTITENAGGLSATYDLTIDGVRPVMNPAQIAGTFGWSTWPFVTGFPTSNSVPNLSASQTSGAIALVQTNLKLAWS